MHRGVKRGLERRNLEKPPVKEICIDEKSYGKGHKYISVLSDPKNGRVLDVSKNRDMQSAESLLDKVFSPEQLTQITREEPLLKGAKYIMLKREENLTDKQRVHFEQIKAANLLTAKAWMMRENFLSVYDCRAVLKIKKSKNYTQLPVCKYKKESDFLAKE